MGWFLDEYVEFLVRMLIRVIRLLRSRHWPVTTGRVVAADFPRATFGCDVATVCYEYVVDGGKHVGTYNKPFVSRDSGVEYAAQIIKGMDFKVRFKPGNPAVSVPFE